MRGRQSRRSQIHMQKMHIFGRLHAEKASDRNWSFETRPSGRVVAYWLSDRREAPRSELP
jgi:hypothetical protein